MSDNKRFEVIEVDEYYNLININHDKKFHSYSLKALEDLLNELEVEKEAWKTTSCNSMNTFSVLSMDCQIVQEAIWDLEKELRYNNRCPIQNTNTEKLLEDLKKKFNDLNKHRIGKY